MLPGPASQRGAGRAGRAGSGAPLAAGVGGLLVDTLSVELVYAIGAYDLLKGFEVAGKNFNRPVETYLVAAVVYFVICFSLSMLVRRLQKKIQIIR